MTKNSLFHDIQKHCIKPVFLIIATFKKYDDLSLGDDKLSPTATFLRTEDVFTVTEKTDILPKMFEKRFTNNINIRQKPIIEEDVIYLDLEPRARYYYVHVMAKRPKIIKYLH